MAGQAFVAIRVDTKEESGKTRSEGDMMNTLR